MNKFVWLVAKHIPDLRRREPENVGVILIAHGQVLSRFHGQKADGTLDGRSTRAMTSAPTYSAWVEYWRHTASTSPIENVIANVTQRRGDDSYFVEVGGERLFGGRDVDVYDMLDNLYGILVEKDVHRESLSVTKLSESVLDRLQIRERVIRNYWIDLGNDRVQFDYRFDNGQANLMQRVSLVKANERSWDDVHVALWNVQRSAGTTVEGKRIQAIMLVKPRDNDRDLDRQIGALREQAKVIDVNNTELAADRLAELLHLERQIEIAT